MSSRRINRSILLPCHFDPQLVHDSEPVDFRLGWTDMPGLDPAVVACSSEGWEHLYPLILATVLEAARSIHPEALSTVCCVVANGA